MEPVDVEDPDEEKKKTRSTRPVRSKTETNKCR